MLYNVYALSELDWMLLDRKHCFMSKPIGLVKEGNRKSRETYHYHLKMFFSNYTLYLIKTKPDDKSFLSTLKISTKSESFAKK